MLDPAEGSYNVVMHMHNRVSDLKKIKSETRSLQYLSLLYLASSNLLALSSLPSNNNPCIGSIEQSRLQSTPESRLCTKKGEIIPKNRKPQKQTPKKEKKLSQNS